jgi:hypothetical protein
MRWPLLVVVVLALVPAGGAATIRSVTAPAPVLALAFDGSSVAYATGRSGGDCNRVFVWNLSTRAVTKLGRRTHCIETSTGNAIGSVAIAGRRVLWLHFAGGNRRNYTIWTATTTSPSPRLIASREVDVDDPPPLVVGTADASPVGSILPYANGRNVVGLRPDGSRAFIWTAPERVVSLGAFRGKLAVASADGRVTILDADGRPVDEEAFSSAIRVVRLSGAGVFVQWGQTLELRGPIPAVTELRRGERLEDADGSRAYLVERATVWRTNMTAAGHRGPDRVARGTRVGVADGRIAVAEGRVVAVRALPRG